MKRTAATLILCLAALSLSACAASAPAPLTRDAQALSDAEIARRTDFIEQRLDSRKTPAEIWHWSWLAVNGGAGVALNTALAATDDSTPARSAAIVQAVYGAIGVATQYADPMKARYGADPLRELPDETREQRALKLQRAEVILQENAARNAQRTSWVMHIGNVVASTAAGLIVYAFGGKTDAVITGASTLAGGELFLWTTPSGPVHDLEDYRALVGPPGGSPAPPISRGVGAPVARAGLSLRF
ncbi:MAG TPA: hypothetical protein VMW19_12465 [Myxococcota bacterium]|nr:hypothetical protein [Myxococcota bacterium]